MIINYFLYFIIYSFIGWLMEVICKAIEQKRFVNRGFLIGPICPIYGYGILFIILLIGNNLNDVLAVFLKSILICSILEYLTSYLMEKLFHARWWDYSKRKYNINGRICLETMIPFGILGTIVIYIIHPVIISFVNLFSSKSKLIIAILLFIIYLIDNIISFIVMNKIKKEINHAYTKRDNTEYIKKQVIKWLSNNSYFYKRIKSSYPNFSFPSRKVKKNRKKTNKD